MFTLILRGGGGGGEGWVECPKTPQDKRLTLYLPLF